MPEVQETDQPQVDEQPKPAARAVDGPDITQIVIKASAIAAVALVAVLAAFIVTTKILRPMLAADPPTQEELLAAEAEKAKSDEARSGGGGHGEEGGGSGDVLFEIEQIIVNPASTVGSRFLSCSVAFELTDQEALSVFESDEIKIRDALITILTARTVDELADPRLREPLRRQILARVNRITSPAEASAVYFKDFVLQ
jgi:flagellar basal body-associated protein FliL